MSKPSKIFLLNHFCPIQAIPISRTLGAAVINDFVLREVLGTLPSLVNLTLKTTFLKHQAYLPQNSGSENGGPKRFDILEGLCVQVIGSSRFIQHLLNLTDSPCLKSIQVHLVLNCSVISPKPEMRYNSDNRITPLMGMVVAKSRWPQSLENFIIGVGHSSSVEVGHRYAIF